MVYYISLFSKIRCILTYLPSQKSDVIYECSLGEKFDVTWDGRRLRPQRPEAGVVNRLSFIPIKDMVYSRYKFKSTSSEESQNLTDNSAEQLTQFPTETETDETRLVLSSADYNLSWGVLTQKRSQYRYNIKYR